MTRSTVLTCLAVLLFVGALDAQEPLPDSVAPEPAPPRSIYDPHNDVLSPSVARGLYAVSLLPQAYLWSWMPPFAFSVSPVSAQGVGAGMLIMGGGVAGTFAATRRYGSSLGSTVLSFDWGSKGYGVGLAVGDLLYDWGQPYADDFRPQFIAATAGGVAGNIIGYAFAARHGLNGGNAMMLGNAGTVAEAYTALIAVAWMDFETDALFPVDRIPWERKVIEVSALAGRTGGTWLWHHYAPRNWTTGDALSYGQAYSLSTLAGLSTYLLLDCDAEPLSRPALAASLLVAGGGFTYGYWYHRNRDLTLAHGLYTYVSTYLGELFGAGLALVVLGDEVTEEALLLPVVIGGWAGFHLGPALARAMPGPSLKSGLFQRVHIATDPTTAVMAYAAAKNGVPVRLPLLSVDF
jgi:hypothetical protein